MTVANALLGWTTVTDLSGVSQNSFFIDYSLPKIVQLDLSQIQVNTLEMLLPPFLPTLHILQQFSILALHCSYLSVVVTCQLFHYALEFLLPAILCCWLSSLCLLCHPSHLVFPDILIYSKWKLPAFLLGYLCENYPISGSNSILADIPPVIAHHISNCCHITANDAGLQLTFLKQVHQQCESQRET